MPADVHHEEESSDAAEIPSATGAGLDLTPRTSGAVPGRGRGGGWFGQSTAPAQGLGHDNGCGRAHETCSLLGGTGCGSVEWMVCLFRSWS